MPPSTPLARAHLDSLLGGTGCSEQPPRHPDFCCPRHLGTALGLNSKVVYARRFKYFIFFAFLCAHLSLAGNLGGTGQDCEFQVLFG